MVGEMTANGYVGINSSFSSNAKSGSASSFRIQMPMENHDLAHDNLPFHTLV